MEFGRGWPLPPVPEGSCYIDSELANQLDVNIGDVIIVSFSWNTVFSYFSEVTKEAFGEFDQYAEVIFMPLKIQNIVSSSYGKWGSSTTNGIPI